MAKVSRFTQDNQNPVGMIVHSMLTESQFQAINGTNWILADGRSVAGSTYATVTGSSTVPDTRGLFLRAAGTHGSLTTANGNAFSATLGSTQNDQGQGHFHDGYGDNGGSGYATGAIGNLNCGAISTGYISSVKIRAHAGSSFSDGTNGTPRTGAETRPANLAVNIFIKIN